MSNLLQSLRTRQSIAVAVITLVTLGVVGTVLVTATSLGCGPANALGIKTISSKCARPVAARTPGIPTPSQEVSATPTFASSPTASPSPSPIPSPSSLPSAGVPATGPATGAYLPFYPGTTGANGNGIPAFTLNCRLPVYVGPSGSGGFIVFPGNTFIADPTSAAGLPALPAGEPSPSPPSPYYGQGATTGYSYDAHKSKWLAVPPIDLTPDGARYAFTNANGIWVEDVGAATLTELGAGHAWNIIGVDNAGVYAMQAGKSGLWFLPFAGDLRQITTGGFWQAASDGVAYGTPTSAVPTGVTNDVIRLNLATGQTATWFRRDGTTSTVLGIDSSGAAILSVNYYAVGVTEVWIVAAPGRSIPIFGSSNGDGLNVYGQVIADSHGTWFPANAQQGYSGSQSGFALYIPGKGTYWMSGFAASLAGGCFQA